MVVNTDNEWIVPSGGDGEFVPVSEGLKSATVAEVTPPELVDDRYNPGKQKLRIKVKFAVDEKTESGADMMATRTFTFSLHPKSALRPVVEALLNRKLAPGEESKFDIRSILNRACQVLIKHNTTEDGKVFANVKEVLADKGQVPF